MYRNLIAIIKLFIKSLFQAPAKIVEKTTNIIEEIKEERQAEFQFNWNVDLVKEFPDEPVPIYNSNLSYKEPIGYIVNGIFVNSLEPGAKTLKTIEEDEWDMSTTAINKAIGGKVKYSEMEKESVFNTLIKANQLDSLPMTDQLKNIGNTYIIKKEDVSED